MKFIKPILLFVTLLFSVNVFAHGDVKHNHQTREQVAWGKIAQGALIIDVRTKHEYNGQSLPNAIHIPHDDVLIQFKSLEIRKDRHVILYCHSGNRAGKALINLRNAGYTNIHNGGGLQDLLNAQK